MEEWILMTASALALGGVGGIIRTIRDTFKRYNLEKTQDLDGLKNAIDGADVIFDIFFGIVAGGGTYLMITGDGLTKAVTLAIVSAGYAGADVLDGIFQMTKK